MTTNIVPTDLKPGTEAEQLRHYANKFATGEITRWDLAAHLLEQAADRFEAALPSGVRVKPLEWEGDGHWSHGPDEGWMEEANTPFDWGYSIEFGREGNFKADSSFGWSQDGFDTPDEAKAAAQADYERRILSALRTNGGDSNGVASSSRIQNRIEFNPDGTLDEVVTDGGAHLEHMGGKSWFLDCIRADGSSFALWINGKVTMHEERDAPKAARDGK